MKKVTIIGSGNIGLSLAKGLINKDFCSPNEVTLTRRNLQHLTEAKNLGFEVSSNNAEAIQGAHIIVLAILPQQLNDVLEEITSHLDTRNQLIVSVISGVTCQDIKNKLGQNIQIIRAMPNTAISIGQSMTCIAGEEASRENMQEVTRMFETVGAVMKINEDLMTAATALCSCGIAFFLRGILAASQGG